MSCQGHRPGRTSPVEGRAGVRRRLHFHPFADGNARSAALALYFVLAREGVVLDRATLLMTRWPAADPHGAEGPARLVAVLIKQTGR